MIPAKCPFCDGNDSSCRCGGTGLIAVTIPDSGPMFTRECPDCGWQNGMYFPQPGMNIPIDGTVCDDMFANCCLECNKKGHMIWRKLA